MRYFIILLAAALMGCRSGAGSLQEHNHDHEAGHDHATGEIHDHEDHDHEGDDHEDRDHEGHDHEQKDAEVLHGEGEIVFTHEQAEAADLRVETIEPSMFRQVISTSGQIQNALGDEAVVAAASDGVVSFAGVFAQGSAVGRGETIAVISAHGLTGGDPAARARIEFETAGREYRRAEELVKDQIISEREFNEAKRRYETARAALPSNTTATGVAVTAPMDGHINTLLVGEGEYVTTGQPIATVTRPGRLQLRAEVSDRWFDALSTVVGANFRMAAGGTVYHTGRLIARGRTSGNGYIPVLFELENESELVPGAFAEVWLLAGPMEGVISVPKSALSEQQGLYFVYVQHGEEDFAKQEVSPGADNGERVQILGGLNPGERVVTRGVTQVRLAAMSGVIPEGHSH